MNNPKPLYNLQVKDAFDTLAAEYPAISQGRAFGYPIYAIGSTMFAVITGDFMAFKLRQTDARYYMKRSDAKKFEPFPGKVWHGWVAIHRPRPELYSGERAILEDAIMYAASEEDNETEKRRGK